MHGRNGADIPHGIEELRERTELRERIAELEELINEFGYERELSVNAYGLTDESHAREATRVRAEIDRILAEIRASAPDVPREPDARARG